MFSAKVSRRTIRDISDIPSGLRGPKGVKVGFPAGKTAAANLNKAVWNEFGTNRGIPERPFMRNTISKNKSKYFKEMEAGAKLIVTGRHNLSTVLRGLGVMVSEDIKSEITALNSPANAASTVARKGSSNPLIDTGEMRGAVTWKIDD